MVDDQAIIIKKIKKGGHGAHGGAWKVAYADFVTAMMAFFLLLWLLSSTSEEQKQGIAEYFSPTVGLKDAMGIGVEGGKSPTTEDGISQDGASPPGFVFGAPSIGDHQLDPTHVKDEAAESESKQFEDLQKEIEEAFEKNPELKEFRDNILFEETAEGLKIHVVDQYETSMFQSGSYNLLPHTQLILGALTKMVNALPNNLTISGHTDAKAYREGAEYTNWELSADRANASRRFMIKQGISKTRFKKVIGRADQEHLDREDPLSPRNRRISILLMKKALSPYETPAPDSLLTPGDASAPSGSTGGTMPASPPNSLEKEALPPAPAMPQTDASPAAEPMLSDIEPLSTEVNSADVLNDVSPAEALDPVDSKTLYRPSDADMQKAIEEKIKTADPSLQKKSDAQPIKERPDFNDPSQFNIF